MSHSRHRLRVRGFHCDLYGHVNNARYLEFLEAARWDVLDHYVDVPQWHERGWLFVIVNIDISYRAALTLGDEISVATGRGKMGSRSATVEQIIERERDGVRAAKATITYVILDRDTQRPLPLTGEIREGLIRMPLIEDVLAAAPGPAAAVSSPEHLPRPNRDEETT